MSIEPSPSKSEAAIWHDVECGAYAADFRVWDELADRCGDPILELGAGTGRLAIHLARRGHRVIGLDYDEALILGVDEIRRQIRGTRLDLEATMINEAVREVRALHGDKLH